MINKKSLQKAIERARETDWAPEYIIVALTGEDPGRLMLCVSESGCRCVPFQEISVEQQWQFKEKYGYRKYLK